ncbi:MAG: AfsR/SARP family transcriptional regulator [Kibdelosporangium sp.]
MRAVHIEILGSVSVTVDGTRQAIGASKVRALLATLALDAGRVVSNTDLGDELWSDRQLGNARNALQAHATRLRKVLDGPDRPAQGQTVLRAVANGYMLDVPREAIDSNRFLDLAGRGAAELPQRPHHALELLQAAFGLWQGPALVDAGDGLRCRGAAALFDERRLTLWEDLISALLAVGEDRRAVGELRRLVAQYPLNERFCEQLMLALYRSGRQGEALELFHRTRRHLDEELGLQPGIPLQQRHAEILAHDPALTLPSAVWLGHREPVATG